MTTSEIQTTATELYQQYGKSGALDFCFVTMKECMRRRELMFWGDVTRYIEENFDNK